MTHGETKMLLELCTNIGQVDEILNKTYCRNDADKADYLSRLFDVKAQGKNAHADYLTLATAVIKHRVA